MSISLVLEQLTNSLLFYFYPERIGTSKWSCFKRIFLPISCLKLILLLVPMRSPTLCWLRFEQSKGNDLLLNFYGKPYFYYVVVFVPYLMVWLSLSCVGPDLLIVLMFLIWKSNHKIVYLFLGFTNQWQFKHFYILQSLFLIQHAWYSCMVVQALHSCKAVVFSSYAKSPFSLF